MIRKARLTDIGRIHGLVKPFADREQMLPLSIGDITERLRDFSVFEDHGDVVGCIALHVTWGELMEIRSLAVADRFQGRGIGRKLVLAAHEEAREMHARELFVLTYVPDFFAALGYERIPREELPHKVWSDCIKCPRFPDCGEVALKIRLEN